MQYEFLKQFPRRMKFVGRFAVLLANSSQKTTWKQYGFNRTEEQINIMFAIMLFIMEQSLKDEVCTIDDIGAYIDNLNMANLHKSLGYDECKSLGDFIINVVLSNEGRAMYFDGYDFEQNEYDTMNISYIANNIVYVNSEVKRTSYYLTDDGYSLILSTLEIENNMKLTVHEMIFKMHLEKQSYDKAVDEIKSVFQLLHIQLQKIEEAMSRIRRNALNYTVAEYENILDENLNTISDTKQKFMTYREVVKTRTVELEQMNLNVRELDEKEEQNLNNLKIIDGYLNRSIDEHQRILGNHFDLKALYTHELEQLSQVSFVKRFSFQNDFYDLVLKNPESLARMDLFLRPLFSNEPDKIYNMNKVTELQRPISKKGQEDSDELMDFGDDDWQEEQEREQREKLKKYEKSVAYIVDKSIKSGRITLKEMAETIYKNADDYNKNILIPNVDIFKEIMVELIRAGEIDLIKLKKERSEYISETSGSFELNEILLNMMETKMYKNIRKISTFRVEDGQVVTFENVQDANGKRKMIRCSNVQIMVEMGED